MKIYLIYLKEDGTLVAQTTSKEFYKRFKTERKIDAHIFKMVKMEENQARIFLSKNTKKTLFENVMSDDKRDDISILTSIEENEILEHELNELEEEIQSINRRVESLCLKQNYIDLFHDATSYFDYGNGSDYYGYSVDVFRLFIEIFKDRFL